MSLTTFDGAIRRAAPLPNDEMTEGAGSLGPSTVNPATNAPSSGVTQPPPPVEAKPSPTPTPAAGSGGGSGFDDPNNQPDCGPGKVAIWVESNPGDPRGLGHWECQDDPNAGGGGGSRVDQYAQDDAACKAKHGPGWEAIPRPFGQGGPAGCRKIGESRGDGGGNGGGGGSSVGGFNPTGEFGKANLPDFIGRSPEEEAILARLNALSAEFDRRGALLFSTGFDALQAGLNFQRGLLTSTTAAETVTGPARQLISETFEGAGLGAGFLRGGQGRQLQADLDRQAAREISNIIAGVQPQAAQSLIQAGGATAQFGQATSLQSAQVLSDVLRSYENDRQLENQFNLNRAQLEEAARQFGLTFEQATWLAERGFELDNRRLDLAAEQLEQSEQLNLERIRVAQEQLLLQQQQFQFQQSFAQQQLSAQNSQAKGSLFGSIFGTLATAGTALAIFSSMRLKADIESGPGPLASLRHVREAAGTLQTWRYRWEQRRRHGLVTELAPRYADGLQLDVPTALGDLFGAVAALADENERLRTRIRTLEEK